LVLGTPVHPGRWRFSQSKAVALASHFRLDVAGNANALLTEIF
jgi:hypothetical protein